MLQKVQINKYNNIDRRKLRKLRTKLFFYYNTYCVYCVVIVVAIATQDHYLHRLLLHLHLSVLFLATQLQHDLENDH